MRIVLAVIKDEQNRILLTQRALNTSQGGRWEFPGGKIAHSESPEDAIVRELREELGIDVTVATYLGEVSHQYPEQAMQFLIFLINSYQGKPYCSEDQLDLQWTPIEQLKNINFPEANCKILAFLQLKHI